MLKTTKRYANQYTLSSLMVPNFFRLFVRANLLHCELDYRRNVDDAGDNDRVAIASTNGDIGFLQQFTDNNRVSGKKSSIHPLVIAGEQRSHRRNNETLAASTRFHLRLLCHVASAANAISFIVRFVSAD